MRRRARGRPSAVAPPERSIDGPGSSACYGNRPENGHNLRVRAATLLSLFAFAGCSEHAGRLVVVVDSDAAIEEVRVETWRTDQPSRRVRRVFDDPVPFSFAIAPEEESSSVDVIVTGVPSTTPDRPIVRHERAGISPNETRVLTVFLAASCAGRACADGETCDAGACIAVPFRPAETLPLLPRGGSEFEVGTHDAGPSDAGPFDGSMDAARVDAAGMPDAGPDGAPPDAAISVVSFTSVISDAAGFGASVALDESGAHLLVGAPSSDAAFLYTDSGGGFGGAAPLSGPAASQFGASVTLTRTSPCVARVGAPGDSSGEGAVHDYDCAGALRGPALMDGSGMSGGRFGASVSMWGLVTLVGSPGRSRTIWFDDRTFLGPTVPAGLLPGDEAGASVAAGGSLGLFVWGAPSRGPGGEVWANDFDGTVVRVLVGASAEGLGSSVAMNGDGNVLAAAGVGVVVVMRWDGSAWNESSRPRVSAGPLTVALDQDGSHLVIGDASGAAAWLFSPASSATGVPLVPAGPAGGFGRAVAVSGDGTRGAVSAPGSGAVYVFALP